MTAKHRKARDTWGKPNLAERFLYHTKIGRFYNDFDQESKHLINFTVVGGLICFGISIYMLIAFFN